MQQKEFQKTGAMPEASGVEPAIEELLDDSTLSLLMAADGVSDEDIKRLKEDWMSRRAAREPRR